VKHPGALAFVAAVLAAFATAALVRGLGPPALAWAVRAVRSVAQSVDAVLRLGDEGREPGALERRRLLVGAAPAAWLAVAPVAGPLLAAVAALAAPLGVSRVLAARRRAYRRAVERDAPAIAVALADALGGGHSLRGALAAAGETLGGAGGAELRRVRAELAAGQTTAAALESFRDRSRSEAVDALVAAALVQHRAGGSLATLLRRLALGFEDQARLAAEVRVATAQARFTGLLVVALPLGGAALAELARPGAVSGIAASPLTAWLVGVALVLQTVAALLIRRLGRVRA